MQGVVLDDKEAPLVGVGVSLTALGTAPHNTYAIVTTDGKGQFLMRGIYPR